MLKLKSLLCFLICVLSMMPGWAAEKYNPSIGYHNYAALTKTLQDLAAQNNKIATLSSIGQTQQKRDIWALQLSGTNGKDAAEKQALLICSNVEADHLIGSEVALGVAKRLISGYGKDDEITKTLDSRTFYIIPRLNPDGAELFFEQTLKEFSGNLRPRDDDYDWQVDEDGPEDLNGDGLITLMRVKDKEGDWTVDAKDDLIMKKKESGTPVDSLFCLYPEGIDNDGDELYNEDDFGGFDINRNFPHNFGYNIKGINFYPASEKETQALIDFMNRYEEKFQTAPHKNICAVLIFSKFDNLAATSGIEGGEALFPEVKQKTEQEERRFFRFEGRRGAREETPQPPAKDPQLKKTNDKDVKLFSKVSDNYKKITGINSAVSDKPFGSLLEWAYFQYGVPSFSANLWSLRKAKKEQADSTTQKAEKPETEKAPRPDRRSMMMPRLAGGGESKKDKATDAAGNDEKWLQWIDKQNKGVGFVKWEKFQHQQLGAVEIGGFYPYLRVNPPASQIDSLSQSHTKFALYLASQFAEISLDEPVVEKLSAHLFKLKTKIHNNGKFPYATAMGEESRNVSPIRLQLKFEDDKDMKLFGGAKRLDLNSLEAGAEKEYEWIIISPPGKKIDMKLWARNGGGTTEKRVVLK